MIAAPRSAVRLTVCGIVQGVGFRPFVYATAQRYGVTGWVRNGEDGLRVHAEGAPEDVAAFLRELRQNAPRTAIIASFGAVATEPESHEAFVILESTAGAAPRTRMPRDLAVCNECLRELFDEANRRFRYPYINCTNCGPRFSLLLSLPYDRERTTMRAWPMCADCRAEYEDPSNRRFHAQPTACHACGPTYLLGSRRGYDAVVEAAKLLAAGAIVALKGIGGYHLACDARNATAVDSLRQRKFRKERPFAVMVPDVNVAAELSALDAASLEVLDSSERPIVLSPSRVRLDGIAPDNDELGVMLPYAPLHHLLFTAGAPDVLVMTSGNRSSEPLAFRDDEALRYLGAIADAFLVGERAIARRVDDSVCRAGTSPINLRRGRGLAPAAVARLPASARPILALGADLKNTITLVVDGEALSSQHIGDLTHFSVRESLRDAVSDLCAMYRIDAAEATIVHDLHPGYYTTRLASELGTRRVTVQHHRAHVASVLAERNERETEVIAFAFDGLGWGDDDTIWGGEIFSGSLSRGLRRVGHLRSALLVGGDAAARFPVQAAAGFLTEILDVDLQDAPFSFPRRFADARTLIAAAAQTFPTTSIGRLFDTVAALLGFTREQTFEGQAAMWLESLAREGGARSTYEFVLERDVLDYRPVLRGIVRDRLAGRKPADIARDFHCALARAIFAVCRDANVPAVVSGGVFQNALLLGELTHELGERLWFNRCVPANDGGISLGQAAIASMQPDGAL